MTQTNLNRRQREQLRHREEILDAALDLFLLKGFHGATVAEIAQKSEFGIGTLYRLFPDGKEGVFRALQGRVVFTLDKRMADLDQIDDPVARLRCFISIAAEIYLQFPKELSLHVSEGGGPGFGLARGLLPDLRTIFESSMQRVTQAVKDAMRQGQLRQSDPQTAAMGLRALLNVLLIRWLQEPKEHNPVQSAGVIEEMFFNGLAQK